jgi:hypothetical protein
MKFSSYNSERNLDTSRSNPLPLFLLLLGIVILISLLLNLKFYTVCSVVVSYDVKPPSLITFRTLDTLLVNSSLCDTSQTDLLRLRAISLSSAILFSTPIVSKPFKPAPFKAGVPAGLQGLKEAIRRIILQELRKR